MNFLTPLTALTAAAITIPLLVLLYFLKLKRREQVVSTTFLWKRAVQDLQVNAPFQRLRRNILLLLQLLALLAVLLALAGPILALSTGAGKRHVILIDRSASMNATDGDPEGRQTRSRLAEAKRRAKQTVDSLRDRSLFSLTDRPDQAMVVAFDETAVVVCSFTEDKQKLKLAIDSIEPTDRTSSLTQAVSVARAFAQAPGEETNNRSAEALPRLILFSDGRISDINDVVAGDGEFIYHVIGHSSHNVAVTAMQARRSYENPLQVQVFATVSNYDSKQVTTDIAVSINGDVVAVRAVTLPPWSRETDRPGQQSVDLILEVDRGGVVEVRQLHADLLASDDAAWSVLAPPKELSVLLVSQGNRVLESALRACPVARLAVQTPAAFEEGLTGEEGGDVTAADVIVLDGVTPDRLARGNYLVFGNAPPALDVTPVGTLENQFLVDWRQQHAVLRYVDLANLFVAEAPKVVFPRDAQILAEFNEGPAMGVIRRQGSTFLLVGFDPLQSNWPFEPGFIIFCYNALAFLGAQSGQAQEAQLTVGDPMVAQGQEAGARATVWGPHGLRQEVTADQAGTLRLPATARAGVYRLEVLDRPDRFFAVNLLDRQESHIEPLPSVQLTGRVVEAQQSLVQKANVPVWPGLILLALLLVVVEWIVYNAKMRI